MAALATALGLLACFVLHVGAAAPEAYDKEQLQAAARFRQQHRKATDGRLCAAASVQDEQTYTGCSVMPTPDGDVGKEWHPGGVVSHGCVGALARSCGGVRMMRG